MNHVQIFHMLSLLWERLLLSLCHQSYVTYVVSIFVYTDQFSCHCVFIYSNFH